MIAAVALLALLPFGPHVSGLVLAFCAPAALVAVGSGDRLLVHPADHAPG